jgi:hypothetical protein
VTPTPSITPSFTPTNSITPSITPSFTPTPSITPSFTPTTTPSITPGLDPEASAFIDAVGGLSAQEQTAIRTLVNSLKIEGIWSGLTAFYPFVGTTLTQGAYNLIDPRNTNDAYRLAFSEPVGANWFMSNGLNANFTSDNSVNRHIRTYWHQNRSLVPYTGSNSCSDCKGFKAFGVDVINGNGYVVGEYATLGNSANNAINKNGFSNNTFWSINPPYSYTVGATSFFSTGNFGVPSGNFNNRLTSHVAAWKNVVSTGNGGIYYEWSNAAGTVKNQDNVPSSNPNSFAFSGSWELIFGNSTYQVSNNDAFYGKISSAYIAGGENALNAFAPSGTTGFTKMTTLTTIMKQFATDLGR